MSPVTYAGNDRIARCAEWLLRTPPSQRPPANVYALVLRDYFKLSSAELVLAEKEADRLREEQAG